MKPETAFTLIFTAIAVFAGIFGYVADGSIQAAAWYWTVAALLLGIFCQLAEKSLRTRHRNTILYGPIEIAVIKVLEAFGLWNLLKLVAFMLLVLPFIYLMALKASRSAALSMAALICILPFWSWVLWRELQNFRKGIFEVVAPPRSQPGLTERKEG